MGISNQSGAVDCHNCCVQILYIAMTKEEALKLKSFKHYCTCGGYAWQISGRPEENPHLDWCPQKAEYSEWYVAYNSSKIAELPIGAATQN